MKTYAQKKEEIRQKAIDFQLRFSDDELNISWWELSEIGAYFERMGKRYGLLREFRENGII